MIKQKKRLTKKRKQRKTSGEERNDRKSKVTSADVFKEAFIELEKAKEDKEVDFDKVTDLYKTNLQELVQKTDVE